MASAVTPERYAKGLAYQDYIAQVKVNKERFDEFYKIAGTILTNVDIDFFRKAAKTKGGPGKIMVIGEDWCPDVYRGLPAVARISEAAGIDLRIFPRDANPDIINEFLNQGKFQSIPVVVFYTQDLKEIGHWIERPASANSDRAQVEEKVKKEMPGASEQDFRTEMRRQLAPMQEKWQKVSIQEWRRLLADKLGLK